MKSMVFKSLLGMLNLALVMGLALFLPAGTTHYPEGWRYLIIFFGGVLAITIYLFTKDQRLLQSRLKIGATAENARPSNGYRVLRPSASLEYISYPVSIMDTVGQMFRNGFPFFLMDV